MPQIRSSFYASYGPADPDMLRNRPGEWGDRASHASARTLRTHLSDLPDDVGYSYRSSAAARSTTTSAGYGGEERSALELKDLAVR